MLTFNRLTGTCHTYSCIGRGFAGIPATAFLFRKQILQSVQAFCVAAHPMQKDALLCGRSDGDERHY